MTSWENVLIDWCNCLELSDKVEELNELRDGAFFKKIFSVLIKSDNPKNEEETIKDFIYLLNDTYGNCKMKCSKRASFSDFSDDELVIFTSLLMHYTCIYDRRDVLTSPLCHNLSKNTQLLIKQFLQMINSDITPTAIQTMMQKSRKTLRNTKYSDVSSPLIGVFETPVSRNSKLHDKDKEIAKLKSTLEMERYEKADLHEELKLQGEKIKRLENLLNKSNGDVTRLRREIAALECRTPPHFRAMDSSDTERRLKKEIQSLEHYIEKSEKEHEEMRDECYSNRKKLAELQNVIGELQTKYFESEKQIEEFKKLSSKQEAKIASLEANCEELNGLLEEYQKKPENESFFETSSISVRRSLPRIEENLACSVVEVQLKEAYMENEELMNKIQILNLELEENAKNMHAKVEECENKCWKMYEETRKVDELRVIIDQMKCDYNTNVEEFTNSFQNLGQLLRNIVENYELSLKKFASELDFEKKKTESLMDQQKKNTVEFEDIVKNLERELSEKDNEIENLKGERNDLFAANEKLSTDLNGSQVTIDGYLIKIQSSENQIKKITDEIHQLNKEKQSLEMNNEEIRANLNIANETTIEYASKIESLKETLKNKETEHNNVVKEMHKISEDLRQLNSNYQQLTAQNEELLNNLEEVKENNFFDKQLLEKIIDEKQEELIMITNERDKYANDIVTLEFKSEDLLMKNQVLVSELEHKISTIDQLENQIKDIQEKLIITSDERDELKKEFEILQEETEQLKKKIDELTFKLSQSEENNLNISLELKTLQQEVIRKEQQFDQLINKKDEILSISKSERDQLISEKNELINKLVVSDGANKKYSDDVQALKDMINQTKSQLKDSEGEKAKFLHEIQTLRSENVQLGEQIEELKLSISRSEENNMKLNSDVDLLKGFIDQKEERLKNAQAEKVEHLNNMQVLRSENEQLSGQLQEHIAKLCLSEENNQKYSADVRSLEEIVDQKERELKKAECVREKYLNDVQVLRSENEQLSAQLKEHISKLSLSEESNQKYLDDVRSLKEILDQKEEELKDSGCKKEKFLNDIQVLRSENEQLDAQLKEHISSLTLSEENNQKYLDDVRSLKAIVDQKEMELKEGECKREKYLNDIQELRSQNEQLCSTLKENISKLSLSEESNQKYLDDVRSLKEILDQKEQELKEAHSDREKYLNDVQVLGSENEELGTQLKEYISKVSISDEALLEAGNKLKSLEENTKEKESALNLIINELNENIQNMRLEYDELKLQKQELESKLFISEQSLRKNIELNEIKKDDAKNAILKLTKELETFKMVHEKSNAENQELLSKLKLSEEVNMNIILSLETDIRQKENEFGRILGEKNELIETLTSNYNESSSKLKVSGDRIQSLENKIEEAKQKLRDLREDKNDLEVKLSDLGLRNKEMESKVIIYEEKLDKLRSIAEFVVVFREKISDTNVFAKDFINKCNSLMKELQEAINTYADKLKNNEQQIEIERNMRESLLEKYNELNETKDKLLIENQAVKDDYINLIKTIGMYNDELDKVVKNLKKGKDSSPILNDVQIAYNEFNIMSPIKSENSGKSDELFQLGQQISKINAYIDVYTEKETFYQKEIDDLRTELANLNSNYFDLAENFKEQNSDNEFQITSLTENLHSVVGKYNQLQTDHREYLNKISGYESEIVKLKKLHAELMVAKDLDMMKLQEEILKLEEDSLNIRRSRDNLLEENHSMKLEYEERVKESEKKFEGMSAEFGARVENLQIELSKTKVELDVLKKKCAEMKCRSEDNYEEMLAKLQVQVVGSRLEITKLEKEQQRLQSDNENLSGRIKAMEEELVQENTIKEKLLKEIEAKELALKELDTKSQQEETSNIKFLEEKQVELQQKIDALMKSNEVQKQTYQFFKLYYAQFKENLDKIISQKNILENLTCNLRILVASINKIPIHETPNFRKLMEKKEAMEIISEDIMKQYGKYSKRINDIVFEIVRYYERNCDNLLSSLIIEQDDYLDNYDLLDLSDQASDLTERTADALEQIKTLQKDLDNLNKAEEDIKTQKENILATSNKINVEKMKEDELKKKNLALKQKVTLLDNAKGNLEKTVKKLREENRKLKVASKPEMPDNDVHYKMLLQEYIAYKEEHEKIVEEYKVKLENLQRNCEDNRGDRLRTSTPYGDEHFNTSRLQADLLNLQEAYASIRTINAKLEAENIRSRKVIEHHEQEALKFNSIKEAYDKLLEENNKLMTDVDTIKYKRTRDRDEFVRLLKEKSDNENRNLKQIQSVKAEYEAKLERMKDKMIKLYREELNKEMNKMKAGQHDNPSLLKIIEKLRGDLFESEQKNQLLEMEREMQKSRMESYNSRESLFLHDVESKSLRDFSSVSTSANVGTKTRASIAAPLEFKHPRKVNPSSLETRKQHEERRASTLPRTGTVQEEITISRTTSVGVPRPSIGPNLEMEDEEEMFNNKYLTDLKQGKCDLPSSSGDRDSRVSELAWRNSLVPPHLKSSYPAEMQFCSPGRFKDDDLKTGNVQFDDSLSKLLPVEKTRKKDFGTTSYKKPGPPTPSKNGGRLSLQGNEIHPARDTYEVKRSTPSRIRALFTGRNSSKSSSEVTSPPKRRLNIFRR